MNKTAEYFEKNSYVVLQDALTKDQAEVFTKHMFDLYEQGKLIKDVQCPLSDAIYGDPVFDDLLQKFAKPIGDAVGRTLLPTYTYARIYRPGEILKRHKDRPSCEISATMTLGFDAKPIWPIFFDEQKEIAVPLDVGELAVYKGCEIVHWRPPFKGQWHVQVFLHYVDANGPYKDCYKDGRQEFGTTKNTVSENQYPKKIENNTDNSENKNIKNDMEFQRPIFGSILIQKTETNFPGYFCIDKNNLPELKFTQEECEEIINLTKKTYPFTASIGTSNNGKIERNIRSAEIFSVDNDDKNRWIYEKVSNVISIANTLHFDYEIAGISHDFQLIEYRSDMEIKGHYDWHIDTGPGNAVFRKISFTAQLSDPNDYEGCELLINNHGGNVVGTKERGSIHLFPSYMPHRVNPITKGTRYALVIWIHGSRRFR